MSAEAVSELAAAIASARHAVALTGAGMSTESGLPDYRGPDGLWRNRRFEELASIQMWARETVEFWEFYRMRLAHLWDASPNPAHEALASLAARGLLAAIVTQNVDGLHAAAALDDTPIHEVHGTLAQACCLACGASLPMDQAGSRAATSADGVPRCDCGAALKPGVVLFGEQLPPAFDAAQVEVGRCDLLLVCGTSLAVWPVAGLADVASAQGARIAVVNVGEGAADDIADIRIEGRVGEVLPRVADLAITLR